MYHCLCMIDFNSYVAVYVVVRAFAEVQCAYPDSILVLFGKGTCKEQILSLVQELRIPNVDFMGVASRHSIGEYYDRADIFINASYLDNMPVSIIEAFACGLPVITTSPPSMRFLVDHERTGLLSGPGDARALAANVVRVLRDPALGAWLATNAFEESRQYHWTAV